MNAPVTNHRHTGPDPRQLRWLDRKSSARQLFGQEAEKRDHPTHRQASQQGGQCDQRHRAQQASQPAQVAHTRCVIDNACHQESGPL